LTVLALAAIFYAECVMRQLVGGGLIAQPLDMQAAVLQVNNPQDAVSTARPYGPKLPILVGYQFVPGWCWGFRPCFRIVNAAVFVDGRLSESSNVITLGDRPLD
jgi:hypothetical protein